MKRTLFFLSIVLSVLLVVSCASSSSKGWIPMDTTTGTEAKTSYTLETMAARILDESLSNKVFSNIAKATGKSPRVGIYLMAGGDVPELDARTLFSKVKAGYVNNGNLTVIAGSSDKEILRTERVDQLSWANEEEAKSLANESATDVILLLSLYDAGSSSTTYRYLLTAQIIEVESGNVVWFLEDSTVTGSRRK